MGLSKALNTTNPNPLRRRIFNWVHRQFAPQPLDDSKGTKKVIELLNSEAPCMISRYGSTELQTLTYMKFHPFLLPLKGRTYYNIQYMSGFFPVTFQNLKKFYKRFKEDAKQIDVLLVWRFEELFFKGWLKHTTRVKKNTVDRFYLPETPWTSALKGKKVLVVHPFTESIESQYKEKRELLFENPSVLPEFASLTTIKAVQSVGGTPVGFDTWFNALKYMEDEIDKVDYDVCIIGCGAYGMPLAAHVKRMGKKAVHLGGVTQILFGIKGRVYENSPVTSKYINEHFVYPNDNETIKNAKLVEGGCYWK